jgi:hypothetical protein
MTVRLDKQQLEQHQSLASVQFQWGLANENQILWLLDQGIDADAITDPYPIGTARVSFQGNVFDVDPTDGVHALTFRCSDHDAIIDLIAWQPESGRIGSWCGVGFCIGAVDDIWNPGTYFGGTALRIHATPIEWLKANREGIVIVHPKLTHAYLANAPCVVLPDEVMAAQFSEAIKPPFPTVEIYIEKKE